MKLGLLTYNTVNLGDEIQSLATSRFVPDAAERIDRDLLGQPRPAGAAPVALVLNGWFGHRPESWPPDASIQPLLVSMHLSSLRVAWCSGLSAEELFLAEPAAEYLRRHGPVGARDLHTLRLLEQHRVPAYFSGCLSLTLRPSLGQPRGEDIVLNEVPDEVSALIRKTTTRQVVHTVHIDRHTPPGDARIDRARALLRRYATAHCVITSRLHCALPCLAMGTPVLLLRTAWDAARFEGLLGLVRHAALAELLSAGRELFDWERPPPNREDFHLLRDSLERTVTAFVAQMRGASAPMVTEPSPMELRYQTLVHLHGAAQAELTAMRMEHERLARSCSVLTAEVEQLRQRLDGLAGGPEHVAAHAAGLSLPIAG